MKRGRLEKGLVVMSKNSGMFTVDSDEGSATEVVITFHNTGHTRVASRYWVKRGEVSDPTAPDVCGVGYDSMKYGYKKTHQRSHLKCYSVWKDMIRRCYDDKHKASYKCYEDVYCCEDWKDFQEFAKWFYSNYKEGYELDKDLLKINNREYSPETCAFLPRSLNLFLVHTRGKDSVGVFFNERSGSYSAYCCDGKGKSINLGTVRDEKAAHLLYKEYKESLAKRLADEYFGKGMITEDVRDALYAFTVDA